MFVVPMPQSKDTQQWKPNAFEEAQINRIASYVVVAERCAVYFHTIDFALLEKLRAKGVASWQGDPNKYPSMLAADNDKEGKDLFRSKCDALCFPRKEPCRAEE